MIERIFQHCLSFAFQTVSKEFSSSCITRKHKLRSNSVPNAFRILNESIIETKQPGKNEQPKVNIKSRHSSHPAQQDGRRIPKPPLKAQREKSNQTVNRAPVEMKSSELIHASHLYFFNCRYEATKRQTEMYEHDSGGYSTRKTHNNQFYMVAETRKLTSSTHHRQQQQIHTYTTTTRLEISMKNCSKKSFPPQIGAGRKRHVAPFTPAFSNLSSESRQKRMENINFSTFFITFDNNKSSRRFEKLHKLNFSFD